MVAEAADWDGEVVVVDWLGCGRREESEDEGMVLMKEDGGEAGVGDGCVGGGEADMPVGLALESFFLHRDVVLVGEGLEAVEGAAVLIVGVLAAAVAPVNSALEANIAAASAALSASGCAAFCCVSFSLPGCACACGCLVCGLLGPAATICAAVFGCGPAMAGAGAGAGAAVD